MQILNFILFWLRVQLFFYFSIKRVTLYTAKDKIQNITKVFEETKNNHNHNFIAKVMPPIYIITGPTFNLFLPSLQLTVTQPLPFQLYTLHTRPGKAQSFTLLCLIFYSQHCFDNDTRCIKCIRYTCAGNAMSNCMFRYSSVPPFGTMHCTTCIHEPVHFLTYNCDDIVHCKPCT